MHGMGTDYGVDVTKNRRSLPEDLSLYCDLTHIVQ